jgi:hypothetical protein
MRQACAVGSGTCVCCVMCRRDTITCGVSWLMVQTQLDRSCWTSCKRARQSSLQAVNPSVGTDACVSASECVHRNDKAQLA